MTVARDAWHSRPHWTRAHRINVAGSMGAETYYRTACQRDYPLDDPMWDEPTLAPSGMPHCKACIAETGGAR